MLNGSGLSPVEDRMALRIEREETTRLGSKLHREPNPASGLGTLSGSMLRSAQNSLSLSLSDAVSSQ